MRKNSLFRAALALTLHSLSVAAGAVTFVTVAGTILFISVAGATPALADPGNADIGLPDWRVGGLAYSLGETSELKVSNLHNKVRIGSSLTPKFDLGDVRPWVSLVGNGAGNSGPANSFANSRNSDSIFGIGGILIDVPLGSFTFTPSIGAGRMPSALHDNGDRVEFRSQLELGYQFDNNARFSFGYSRIDPRGGDSGSNSDNIFGLYYRLPLGSLIGQ